MILMTINGGAMLVMLIKIMIKVIALQRIITVYIWLYLRIHLRSVSSPEIKRSFSFALGEFRRLKPLVSL